MENESDARINLSNGEKLAYWQSRRKGMDEFALN